MSMINRINGHHSKINGDYHKTDVTQSLKPRNHISDLLSISIHGVGFVTMSQYYNSNCIEYCTCLIFARYFQSACMYNFNFKFAKQ